jgi:hypothetical protein
MVRKPNFPVKKAFRTAGLIRSAKPYAIIVDDIQKDDQVHHYDWTLALEYDIQLAKIESKNPNEMEIILCGFDPDQTANRPSGPIDACMKPGTPIPEGTPLLLVRVLNRTLAPGKAPEDPDIVGTDNLSDAKKYGKIRRMVLPADSISPDFKVLLYPHRQGDALPVTTWNKDRTEVTVALGKSKDVINFSPGSLGKTNLSVSHDGAAPVSVKAEIKPIE